MGDPLDADQMGGPLDAGEEETRTQEGASLGAVSGPRAMAFWEGGVASVALPTQRELAVGRSKVCDLRIDHPSVSRRHVLLRPADGQHAAPTMVVEDLASSNGTRINGRQMETRATALIMPGDVVEIGSAVLLLHAGPPERDQLVYAGSGERQRLVGCGDGSPSDLFTWSSWSHQAGSACWSSARPASERS